MKTDFAIAIQPSQRSISVGLSATVVHVVYPQILVA